jgi:Tol biopolymer transport system component
VGLVRRFGYQAIAPVVTADGKHVAFLSTDGGKPVVVMDGKTIALDGPMGAKSSSTTGLAFTPDGQRWVFTNGGEIYVDGVAQKDINFQGQYEFSPDSQHLLLVGASASDPSKYGLFLDGKLVATGPGVSNANHPAFTRDSQHVFWAGHRPPATSTDYDSGVLYVDGNATGVNFVESDLLQPGNWDVSPDGVLTFIARSGGDLKRFHVAPGTDTSLTTMLANAQETGSKK